MSLYNKIFGVDPSAPIWIKSLQLDKFEVPRFRDCYLNLDDDNKVVITLLTRMGEGSWSDEKQNQRLEALRDHPNYLEDFCDELDKTYLYVNFSVPSGIQDEAKKLIEVIGKPLTVEEKFTLLTNRKSGKQHPDTERFEKVTRDIAIELGVAIEKAFQDGTGVVKI